MTKEEIRNIEYWAREAFANWQDGYSSVSQWIEKQIKRPLTKAEQEYIYQWLSQ